LPGPASLATNWLTARLRAFASRQPGIEVTVHATIRAEPTDQITDLGITPRHAGQPVLGIELQPERLLMVCAPTFLQEPVALEMAIAGLGCAVTLASLTEIHLRRGLFVVPFLDQIATDWRYDLHVGNRSPTHAAEFLLDFLAARGSPALSGQG